MPEPANDPAESTGRAEPTEPKKPGARRPRRATTPPPPGTDPTPTPEPDRHQLTENDERLKAEKPPHY